jgi:hypothetical protein
MFNTAVHATHIAFGAIHFGQHAICHVGQIFSRRCHPQTLVHACEQHQI